MLLFASPCAFAMRVYQEEETPTKCAKVSIVGNLGSGKTSIYKRILGENVVLEETHNVENQTRMYRQENICKIVNNTVLSIKNTNGHFFTLDKRHLDEFRRELEEFINIDEYFKFALEDIHELSKLSFYSSSNK